MSHKPGSVNRSGFVPAKKQRAGISPAATAVVHALHTNQAVDGCRVCGCAEYSACPGGCAWVNRERTLCSACLDRRFRLVPSRRGGYVSLVDKRSGYRRPFASPREAARAAVEILCRV